MSSPPPFGLLKLLLATAGIGYLGLAGFALLFANRLVFPAPPTGYGADPGITYWTGRETGQRVSVLFLENPASRFLVFYQHGNGEDLASVRPRLEYLRQLGYAVLAWDYPGYGTSEGRPSEPAIKAIVKEIWDEIPTRVGVPHDRVILYGRSVGGGPATWLAASEKAAGLILEGTFTSVFRVVLPVNILPWDIFDNLALIDRIQCPVLFLHGTDDRVVPFRHSQRLHQRASPPKSFTWFDGGGHNDLVEAYADIYASSLLRFSQTL